MTRVRSTNAILGKTFRSRPSARALAESIRNRYTYSDPETIRGRNEIQLQVHRSGNDLDFEISWRVPHDLARPNSDKKIHWTISVMRRIYLNPAARQLKLTLMSRLAFSPTSRA